MRSGVVLKETFQRFPGTTRSGRASREQSAGSSGFQEPPIHADQQGVFSSNKICRHRQANSNCDAYGANHSKPNRTPLLEGDEIPQGTVASRRSFKSLISHLIDF